jgi:hypothetical protein
MLVYFMAIWSIFRPFGIFYGTLVYFSHFGMLPQEKSGNPASGGDGDLNNLWGRLAYFTTKRLATSFHIIIFSHYHLFNL